MRVLESLPAEILRQILGDLEFFDLHAITLVSRFFNSIGEPFLYASLGNYEGWLTPALRAIVTRPALARHVRSVDFSWWMEADHPDPSDGELFSAAAKQLGVDARYPWTEETEAWSKEARALLLLHFLPNTNEIRIDRSPLLNRFFESTLSTPIEDLPFKSLRRFQADEYIQPSLVTPKLLLALMRLPSLRDVVTDLQFAEDYTHDASVITGIIAFARQSPITNLSLHFGNTTTSMLQHILQMPRALTHFSYADDSQYPYTPDTTIPLRSALGALRQTLKSLSLGGLRALQLGQPGQQTIGSLHDWPALTTIRCSLTALLGTRLTATCRLVDLLPMGIRELEVRRLDELSHLRSTSEWTVTEMTDQLVLVVLHRRQLVRLTVDTCSVRYTVEMGWVNAYEAAVKDRLVVACGVRPLCVVVS